MKHCFLNPFRSQLLGLFYDFGYFIQPWKDEFLRMPFDVTKRKKWADYVAECHATGKEIDYDNYDWDK